MHKIKNYNLFIFLSTLVRNLIEVFSGVLLYKMGYSITNILLFISVMSIAGLITDYMCIKIKCKTTLIISSILYGISFYYLSVMTPTITNLIIFAILLSMSNYSYTLIKHLLAIILVDNSKKSISIILIFTYFATIISSLIGAYLIEKLSLEITSVIIIVLSLLSIIPISKLKLNNKKEKIKITPIPKNKILFNIFEQFKVIFITLQPLYLYLNVNNDMYYIGIFNTIINIASLIVIYIISKKINNKCFKYLNLILCISLLLKLNIKNNIAILFVAFLEGIGQKIYEIISLENLYTNTDEDINSYLITEEIIYCTSRAVIAIIFLVLIKDLTIMLYISIVGIFISGFFIKNTKNKLGVNQ